MKKILGILLFIGITLNANAQLLWKISGNGLEKPSYILGTHHLAPLSIKDSIAGLPQAVDGTSQVYGEVVMSEAMSPEFMQTMQQNMMMAGDTTLQVLFTPEQYELVGKAVKENLMADIAMLAKMKPAFITQQLTLILCMKHLGGFNPQEQLDTYFQQQAIQSGKKVGGLETPISQINVLLNSQTLQRQANLLYCLVSDIDKAMDQTKRLNNAYKAIEDVQNKETGEIPMHIRNAPVEGMEALGYHEGYLYPHDFPGHYVEQQYLPDKMLGVKYYIKDENIE